MKESQTDCQHVHETIEILETEHHIQEKDTEAEQSDIRKAFANQLKKKILEISTLEEN